MNHDDLIRRLATATDEKVAGMVSPQTRNDLADQIMRTGVEPGPARQRRRVLFVGAPLAAAVTAAVVAASGVSSGSPGVKGHPGPVRAEPAALTFSTQGGYLVVKVKDPLADPARYNREFAAHGMNIDLKLVPASPTVVGTVVMSELPQSVKFIPAKGKCFSDGACPVGVRIPLSFHGSGVLVFGRAARPGEPYNSTNSAFVPGESLHCVDIRSRTVDEALATLRRHKVTVGLFNYASRPGYFENTSDRGKIPGTWYVKDADPYTSGQVMLFVQKAKPGHGGDEAYHRRLNAGCRP